MQILKTEAERDRLTLEGLADVDAGRTVDHEAAVAWAESLSTGNPRKPLRVRKIVDGRVKPGHDVEK